MRDPEILVSVDVEASGPSPSTGSLIAIGACLVDEPQTSFYRELEPIPGVAWDSDLERIHGLSREHLESVGAPASEVVEAFGAWVTGSSHGRRPVMVSVNVAFDWMFVADYFARFGVPNPFGVAPLDLKALFMGRFSVANWADTNKASMVSRVHVELPHTHHALDDARMQAELASRLLVREPVGE